MQFFFTKTFLKNKVILLLLKKKLKVFFVIAFTNGISYLDMANATVRLGFNARTDRGALELNHYAFIPLDQFKTAEPLNIMD